jgi:hypothetical protein
LNEGRERRMIQWYSRPGRVEWREGCMHCVFAAGEV